MSLLPLGAAVLSVCVITHTEHLAERQVPSKHSTPRSSYQHQHPFLEGLSIGSTVHWAGWGMGQGPRIGVLATVPATPTQLLKGISLRDAEGSYIIANSNKKN